MKKKTFFLAGILGACIGFCACTDDKETTGGTPTVHGRYVIAAIGEDADYLLQSPEISKGKISALGEGKESSGNRNWIFHKDAAYSFLYANGDPGKATAYVLDEDGQLRMHSELDLSVSITTRGIYNNDIVLINSTRSLTDPRGTFYFVDAVKHTRTEPLTVNTRELAAKAGYPDKVAYFTDVAQVDDKLYLSYKLINGTGSGNANTMKVEVYGKVFIAVYNYNEKTNELAYERTLIDQGRTSFVAGATQSQAETGVAQIDNGDVYVFSSATEDPSGQTDYPSAVLRIKKDATTFDADYFFNIEKQSDNHHLYRVWYMGGDTFVLQMYSQPDVTSATKLGAFKFAVVDVAKKTFQWVEGMPPAENITAVSKPYVSKVDKTIAFGITTKTENPHIYIINAITATANKGVEVVATGISGIGKLNY